ncbi:hypothetical protein [Roseovarius amoyensis]|uniref:hypothetical protein n=1 Tax=Roseovarius amoyensis TaxID=2211448 RepID=UPI000DBE4F58|nr:hypothetical protein [Roseovarius amoyensis]
MGRKYKHTAGGRNFVIFKDYFGNWSIRSADENFETVVGAPPFSVGHRTKRDAISFLDGLAE